MSALKGAAAGIAKAAAPRASVGELVQASRGGDRRAFETLYERYRAATHGVALSYVPADAAGDIVQEAFARALAKLDSLREPSRFGGWLMTIARNAALDAVRHRGRHRGDTASDDVGASDPPRVEAARVLGVLRSLPETYREPLITRLVEGVGGPEIAEKTGMTPGSVRVNLHRGMTVLRSKLGETISASTMMAQPSSSSPAAASHSREADAPCSCRPAIAPRRCRARGNSRGSNRVERGLL